VSNRPGNIRPVSDPIEDDLDALSLGRQDGDMNCNFDWDAGDVVAFATALESPVLYDDLNPFCGTPSIHGDLSLDGRFDFQDKDRFVRVMTNAGTLRASEIQALLAGTVPEPTSREGLLVGAFCLLSFRRGKR